MKTNHFLFSSRCFAIQGWLSLSVVLFSGCLAENHFNLNGQADVVCMDLDRDGYGRGCDSGWDCDDHDPEKHACEITPEPCQSGSAPESCYVVGDFSGDEFECHEGTRYCVDGYWSSCQDLEDAYSVNATPFLSGLITDPTACSPCNPACYSASDFPDGTDDISANSDNVVFDPGAGGLILPTTGSNSLPDADGDGVPDDWDSDDSNPAVDGYNDNGEIFHVLPYNGPTVVDPLVIDTQIRSADVYFMMDTTGSMQQEIDTLKASMSGLITSIQAEIPFAEFGVGYFDDIPYYTGTSWPYGITSAVCNDAATSTTHDLPFVNLLDITDNATDAQTQVNRLVAKCGQDIPESQLPALYAVATGSGVHNGTGSLPAGATTSIANTNETQATAYDAGDLTTTFKKFSGSTRFMANDYAPICASGSAANDAVYRFTLSAPTHFAASTYGSTVTGTSLELRDADFNVVACQADTYGMSGNRSFMTRHLDAGTYYIIVDNQTSLRGNYNLSMGAWSDWYAGSPVKTTCTNGDFGYPCFREGSIPIVVMITDAKFHGGPNPALWASSQQIQAGYSHFPQPTYPEALEALLEAGVKVIGINSDTVLADTCGPSCDVSHIETQCGDYSVCTASHVDTVCAPRRVCNQDGTCYTEIRCQDVTVCDMYSTVFQCNDVTVCDGAVVCTPNYTESQFQLRQLATDTGTVDENGEPLVYRVGTNGAGLDTSIVDAIETLANVSRLDISLRVNDNSNTAGVDESGFIKDWRAVATASSDMYCTDMHDNWFEACRPGTNVQFEVDFQNDLVQPLATAQTFTFTIDVMGDNSYILSTVPVTIVVPPIATVDSGSYWRDYDATNSCQGTSRPDWNELTWTASFPAGTFIEWEIRAANDEDDLDSATPITFSAPVTPSPVNVGDLLVANGITNFQFYLRVTATLNPSPAGDSPVLNGFELNYICIDGE